MTPIALSMLHAVFHPPAIDGGTLGRAPWIYEAKVTVPVSPCGCAASATHRFDFDRQMSVYLMTWPALPPMRGRLDRRHAFTIWPRPHLRRASE